MMDESCYMRVLFVLQSKELFLDHMSTSTICKFKRVCVLQHLAV